MKNFICIGLLLMGVSCKTIEQAESFGSIERLDATLDAIVAPDAEIEILAEGYEWSEGPVWVASENMLLFSDVPTNIVYRWKEGEGTAVFLKPSGYTGSAPTTSREPGSNGLALTPDGHLVICQHGDRRLAMLDAPFDAPRPAFKTIVDNWQGKRFNSPNDVAVRSNGDYFFTDPPYGLASDSAREIEFHGVYKASRGEIALLVDSITRPNGIALMPEENTIIIANSDREKPVWYAYEISGDDVLTNGRIFYDASDATDEAGLPDGLKIDQQGNVFATGPGGIWIFDRNARLLGKIRLPVAAANCAFSDDEKTLFITADNYLLRLRLRP